MTSSTPPDHATLGRFRFGTVLTIFNRTGALEVTVVVGNRCWKAQFDVVTLQPSTVHLDKQRYIKLLLTSLDHEGGTFQYTFERPDQGQRLLTVYSTKTEVLAQLLLQEAEVSAPGKEYQRVFRKVNEYWRAERAKLKQYEEENERLQKARDDAMTHSARLAIAKTSYEERVANSTRVLINSKQEKNDELQPRLDAANLEIQGLKAQLAERDHESDEARSPAASIIDFSDWTE
jgi:hypothetical protein